MKTSNMTRKYLRGSREPVKVEVVPATGCGGSSLSGASLYFTGVPVCDEAAAVAVPALSGNSCPPLIFL